VLLLSSDGTYENGYSWSSAGVVPPTFGAFAERYDVAFQPICSIILDLTQTGAQAGQTLDAYVWDSFDGEPGLVISAFVNVDPGPVALWPSISRHVVNTDSDPCPAGEFWAGYWGNWPGTIAGWFVGADIDGFGKTPYTNIAPGIGYPSGWSHVSVVWGPTAALGIGVEYPEGSFCDIFPSACCLPDGSCYVTSDVYDCEFQGGEFLVDTECEPDPCGPTPVRTSSWGAIKRLYSN
jgi:hypothetical protein